MKKILLPISLICYLSLAIACNQHNTNNTDEENSAVSPVEKINSERSLVKKEPVASYDFPLPDDLNKWHFKVSLSETKQRFTYLLHMQYQEMEGADSIRFPNFGMEPEPRIQKGNTDLECIIGFLDKTGLFREYIKVSVENDQLKMKTLKHYAVYEK